METAPAYDPIVDYIAAAHGDPSACYRLSCASRASVLDGSDDELTASMEGATLARLAAIRGDMLAALLMAQHLITVAEVYEAAGDSSHARQTLAESVALLELCDGRPPAGWEASAWSDHVAGIVAAVAIGTDAALMESVKAFHTLWNRFLGIPNPHPLGDAP